ncbi:CAP domain-containing protein [Streptomyces sp. NPDC046197]|uniref:CAP domain-containing protein n=1 Tax=Streptomyces sp. NPDC046197 TaxID=3154337 RepID=UPI0033D2FA90
MGRHRRSDAGRATGVTETQGSHPQGHPPRNSYDADDRMGIAPYLNPDVYAEAYTRTQEYLFATDDDFARATDTVVFPPDGFTPSNGPRQGGGHRRRKKAATPVRTGLLGVSAAVAIGTVAVATGAVPGLQNYKLGGGTNSGADKVQADGSPSNSESQQGGTSGSVENRGGGSSTSRGSDRSGSPTRSASSPASPSASATPSATPTTSAPSTKPAPAPAKTKEPKIPPPRKGPKAPAKTQGPAKVTAEAAAEAEVLRLVNQERAKVGCSPVAANSTLTDLAETFSKAMAVQDFFDHTDPSGASPWDRAAKLGISNLGGENIARGQADAAAVMDAWMNSPGHRANILNCDFKTLGVGVHFGPGGPWWTQDFGY